MGTLPAQAMPELYLDYAGRWVRQKVKLGRWASVGSTIGDSTFSGKFLLCRVCQKAELFAEFLEPVKVQWRSRRRGEVVF